MTYSEKVRQLAIEIAESEIERQGSVALMQGEPSIVMSFPKLLGLIREECQQELDEVAKRDQSHVLERFAADAGYLIGRAVGWREAHDDAHRR